MFNDFDLSVYNDIYTLNIHDDASDDSVIIVDFVLNEDLLVDKYNQMIIKSIDILESLLLCYFGFNDSEVAKVLEFITEIN